MNIIGKNFLNATNGGLEIFKKYLENPFELDKFVYVDNRRFIVTWNKKYENYAIYIDFHYDGLWINRFRLNAIWFIVELFNISESQVYEKLDSEMSLGILKTNTTNIPIEKQLIQL